MNRTTALAAAVSGGVFAGIGLSEGSTGTTIVRLAVFGAAAGAVALVDLRERRIPNRIVLPAAGACALLAGPSALRAGLPGLVLVAGLLLLALLRPAALGMGDVKEALLVAVALGAASATALLLGLVLAAVAALAATVRRGRVALGAALPLAPFLAAGAALALLR